MFALFLVACGGSNFPTVSESNKVTLTSEEAQEKISEIKEPEEKILKSAMKLKMEDKTMGFNAKINGTATGYQSDNELYFEVNVAGSSGSERASMGIKMYYINSMLYMNMTEKREGQTESVKYKTNVSGLEEAMGSGVVGFSPAEFNEEIISNLFSTELIDADFDGLSYYEKDDEFSV